MLLEKGAIVDIVNGNDPFFDNDPFESDPFLDDLSSALELEGEKKEAPPAEPPKARRLALMTQK